MNYKEELAKYELNLVVDGITEGQMKAVKGGANCLHTVVCKGKKSCMVHVCDKYRNCKLIGSRTKCTTHQEIPEDKNLCFLA